MPSTAIVLRSPRSPDHHRFNGASKACKYEERDYGTKRYEPQAGDETSTTNGGAAARSEQSLRLLQIMYVHVSLFCPRPPPLPGEVDVQVEDDRGMEQYGQPRLGEAWQIVLSRGMLLVIQAACQVLVGVLLAQSALVLGIRNSQEMGEIQGETRVTLHSRTPTRRLSRHRPALLS